MILIILKLPTTSSAPQVNVNEDEQGPSRKIKRFNEISREIRTYSKPQTSLCKGAAEIATDRDLLWLMSLSRIDSVPMWLGYNA